MGKTYKEQTSYDYLHSNKPINKSEYRKLKNKWTRENFGLSKADRIKKKYE
jgi:hypothetical protein